MLNSRQIIAIILSIVLALSSGSIAFAYDDATAEVAEETEAAEILADEQIPEATEPTEITELTEMTEASEGEAADDETASVEIARAVSPVEASQAAPAADNEAFFTIDLNSGRVTDQSDSTVENGFAEIFGETYAESGLKKMSDAQREEQIAEMTEETELYSVTGTDGDAAEITSIYASCRLIVDEEAAGSEVDTFGAVQAVAYGGSIVLSYENEEAAADAYQKLCERYGEENVLVDLPVKLLAIDMAADNWGTDFMGFKNVAPGIKTYGDNVTVAVVDSGVNRAHSLINDGRTIYKGYDFANNDKNPADDNGHGTAVTSIITQNTGTNVRILPIKVADKSGASSILNVLYGVEFARTSGADLANISLGIDLAFYFDNLESANAWITKADAICKDFRGPIISSAGNRLSDVEEFLTWPAVSKYTIAVSALKEGNGEPVFDAGYSNYGTAIDYAAPGTGITVADYATAAGTFSSDGTSCAAPHITAAAALLMANKYTISTKAQVKTALNAICKDLDPEGKDILYGNGCPVFSGTNLTIDKSVRSISKATVKAAAAKTYTGKVIKPVPTVKFGRATLVNNKNYTVKYANNKSVGKASIIITGKGVRHTGKKTVYFKINPKGTKLTKYKSAKKAMTLYWSKQKTKMSKARITGYQIQLATNTKFTKNKKTVTVKGYKNTKKKIKKLKKKTRYYARIRTYMKTKTGTYYSPWSKTVYGYSK